MQQVEQVYLVGIAEIEIAAISIAGNGDCTCIAEQTYSLYLFRMYLISCILITTLQAYTYSPGEEEEFELTEEEQEEGPEALSACANDAEVDGKPAWSPVFSSRNEGVKYQVAGIKSNLWPGAYAVC